MPPILTLSPPTIPLSADDKGVLRVTGTRIPLERVIECYQEGMTPEAIVDAFDSLRLADVYLILPYYLDHKEEVQEYLREREDQAEAVRELIQAPRPGMREELLARKSRRDGAGQGGTANAQAGD